ncbi:MAG: GNAT family N-acetyltransferase [Pseudoflavonifractor sp.]|nr:GNAT family N-acetyltransferase [Pseudoflavonifractor sp.]
MSGYLENDIVRLRALEPTDLDCLYRWENDTSLWEVGNSIAPFSRKQLWDYIESYDGNIFSARQLRLMIESVADGASVGTLDFYDFDPFNSRSAVGILIDRRYSRQGYGTAALELIAGYSRGYLGLHQLVAVIPASNEPSIGLFRKCGYKICGRLRSWLKKGTRYEDAFMLQLML